MKNLIIYYSLEGNTKFVAEIIAKETNSDILELKPKKEISTKGFKKYIWGGKSAIFRDKPILINEKVNLKNYDNLFLGTPIWAGIYNPVYNTFLEDNIIKNKNIFIFATHDGAGASKCFIKFKSILNENNFISEESFIKPLKNVDETNKRVVNWINTLSL